MVSEDSTSDVTVLPIDVITENPAAAHHENEVKGGPLLDVVIRERMRAVKKLSGENQTLLIGRDAVQRVILGARRDQNCYSPCSLLNLVLHVINGVGRLDLECNRLAGQSLHKDLHCAMVPNNEIER